MNRQKVATSYDHLTDRLPNEGDTGRQKLMTDAIRCIMYDNMRHVTLNGTHVFGHFLELLVFKSNVE